MSTDISNHPQDIRTLNPPVYKKNYTPHPSGIYPSYTRLGLTFKTQFNTDTD
jgi:hypothetical protein